MTKLNEKYYFFKSLDKRYKAASIFVITILFTNALFEMLAIGILYPFVSMLVNSGEKLESDFDNEIFYLISQYLNIDFSINKILYFISYFCPKVFIKCSKHLYTK